jgi:hypothetical protein
LKDGKVVSGELVIARCNPATVLDLVEEALDQVPSAVEIRAEADRRRDRNPAEQRRPAPPGRRAILSSEAR